MSACVSLSCPEPDRVVVRPVGIEGSDYEAMLESCREAGCRYMASASGHVAPIECLGTLLDGLVEADLTIRCEPSLVETVRTRVGSMDESLGRLERFLEKTREHYDRLGRKPRPYQLDGTMWMALRKHSLNSDFMRGGKSMQVLLMAAAAEHDRILVVCPANAKGTWHEEVGIWRPDLKPEILEGRRSFRWPLEGEVLILNFTILPARKIEFKKEVPEGTVLLEHFRGTCPDGLLAVCDEAHNCANASALQTSRWRLMTGWVRDRGGRLVGLTGTPIPNRQETLWGVLVSLGLHRETFGDHDRFCKLMGGVPEKLWKAGGRIVMTWDPERIDPEVHTLLGRVMIRRTLEQMAEELSEREHQDVPVTIDRATWRLCDEAMADLERRGISLEEAMELLESGHGSIETLARARVALANAKIQRLLELVSEFEEADEPIVVASDNLGPLQALKGREGWGLITGEIPAAERQQAIVAFREGKLRGIGLSIRAGGTGIDLSRARYMIFVNRAWSVTDNSQAESRILSVEQGGARIYPMLRADHPLERRMDEILDEKTRLMEATIGKVQRRIAEGGLQDLLEREKRILEMVERLAAPSGGQNGPARSIFEDGEMETVVPKRERDLHAKCLLLARMTDPNEPDHRPEITLFDAVVLRELARRLREGLVLEGFQWAQIEKSAQKYAGILG